MKGFRKTFVLNKGLRVRSTQGNNTSFLLSAKNVRLDAAGLELLDPITNITDDEIMFPFPQYKSLKNKKLICEEGKVSIWDGTTKNLLISTYGESPWDVADFGDYIIIGNGDVIWEILPDGTANEVDYNKVPKMQTFCESRGQLVGANIIRDWYDCDDKYAVWSNIGEVTFVPDRKNEAGYRHMGIGSISRCREMANGVIAFYGDDGIATLTPIQGRPLWKYDKLCDGNFPYLHAVAGDDYHITIDRRGALWQVTNKAERLGYEEWLSTLDLDNIMISYDGMLKDYYISDGAKTFVFNEQGMTEFDGMVTSLSRSNGELVGYAEKFSADVEVKLVPIDLNLVGMKSLEMVEVGIATDGAVSAMSSVFYELSQVTTGELYIPVNNSGFGYFRHTGNTFIIGVKVKNPSKANLDFITAGFKLSDNRVQSQLQTLSEGRWDAG